MSKENKDTTDSAKGSVAILWWHEFFLQSRTMPEVAAEIARRWQNNFPNHELSKALSGAKILLKQGKRGSYQYKQRVSPKSQRSVLAENVLLPSDLIAKLQKDFSKELDDLRFNFGVSGICTAFLLRKILEKLTYIVFCKYGRESKIEDTGAPSGLVGLEKMIDIASKEKIDGIPILTRATISKIKSVKFLGDASAHNPLANVDNEDIILQAPYLFIAFKELAKRL